jgi:hypothetical protein
MSKTVSLAILFVVALGVVYPLARQNPADTITVYGAGATPCSTWTQHLTDKAAHPGDVQWVFGFVSAAGVFAGVHLKVDADAIEPFMTKYCQEHPTSTVTTAAANLVGSLR